MKVLRSVLALVSAGMFSDVHAQWEWMGSPSTYGVSFLVAHQDKAHVGISGSLFAGDREAVDRTVFYQIDPAATGLSAALSWGDQFVTGSTAGRVVVYSDVSMARRRIDGHPTTRSITSLAALGPVLLMGANDGVHRSTDTLQSAVRTTDSVSVRGVNRLEVFDGNVYAATDSGLFVSRDTGVSWIRVPAPRRKVLDVARHRDTLYLGTEAGLHPSADDGATWLEPLFAAERFPRLMVRGGSLFVATQTDLWRKDPDGGTWRRVQPGLAGRFLDVEVVGRLWMVASAWGVAVSEEGGPWVVAKSATGAARANIQALSTDGTHFLAGTDTRGTFVSSDRGRTWAMRSHPFHYGAVYGVLANAFHDGFWYSTTLKGVHRSADSGFAWDLANNGLPADLQVYAFHPRGERLWMATGKGVFSTQNHGDTWTATPGRPAGAAVYDLAITRDGLLWAATDTCLQSAPAPYQTWTPATDLPRGTTLRLAQRGDTLYASSSAAGPWRSLDGGANWKVVRDGLPGSYLQRIQVGSRYAFAANGLGKVFVLAHADTSWQTFQGDLPDVGIDATLLLDDTVFAASRFGGLYRRALPDGSTGTGSRTSTSRPAFAHDAAARSLRFLDPASMTGATVRDLSGRIALEASAHTSWLSLGRLPPGLYTLSMSFRDRPSRTERLLQR